MSFRSGKNSDAKKLMLRLPELQGDDELYQLNRAQIKSLLTLSESIGWMSRHLLPLPSYADNQDKLQAFADETARDLMMPIDLCSEIVSCEDEILAMLSNALLSETPTSSQQGFRDAIEDMLTGSDTFISTINNYNGGFNGKLVEADSNDILWAQCVQITEYTHAAISDLLEILEVQSNNTEMIQYLNFIPGMKAFLTLVPIDDVFLAVNHIVSTIGEQYYANYTETIPSGTKYIIACAIFCICKDDKKITVPRVCDAIYSLLDNYLTPNWDNAQELIETIIGVNDNSPVAAYGMFFMVWGSAKLMGGFGLENVNLAAISTILKLAINDANDDWETICEDCSESIEECMDFTTDDHGWYPAPGGWGVRDSGGLAGEFYSGDSLYYFTWIWFDNPGEFTEIRVEFNEPVSGFELIYNSTDIMYRNTGSIGTSFVADVSTKGSGTPFPFVNNAAWTLRPTNAGRTVPSTLRVIEICLTPVEE